MILSFGAMRAVNVPLIQRTTGLHLGAELVALMLRLPKLTPHISDNDKGLLGLFSELVALCRVLAHQFHGVVKVCLCKTSIGAFFLRACREKVAFTFQPLNLIQQNQELDRAWAIFFPLHPQWPTVKMRQASLGQAAQFVAVSHRVTIRLHSQLAPMLNSPML